MARSQIFVFAVASAFCCMSYGQEVWGVELMVQDGDSAGAFFRDGLGFESVAASKDKWQLLAKDDVHLLLTRVESVESGLPGLELNFQVGHLARATAHCLDLGAVLANQQPHKSAIGPFNQIQVPGGPHAVNLMELDGHTLAEDEVLVFNASLSVPDIAATEAAFIAFGFSVFSRDYLPATLPFQKLGQLPLVAHPAAESYTWTQSALLFSVADVAQGVDGLNSKSVPAQWEKLAGTATGPWFELGPVRGKLINPAVWVPVQVRDEVQIAFARIKSLAGTWRGTSTAGWTSDEHYRAIAYGTTVVGTSFDDHHDAAMMTVFTTDDGELILTHYCAARNQPKLRLKECSADGKRLSFEFVGGGNLATRDRGHMDAVFYDFSGPDHFTSRWQWYQNGRYSWMEEIEYHRVSDVAQSSAGK